MSSMYELIIYTALAYEELCEKKRESHASHFTSSPLIAQCLPRYFHVRTPLRAAASIKECRVKTREYETNQDTKSHTHQHKRFGSGSEFIFRREIQYDERQPDHSDGEGGKRNVSGLPKILWKLNGENGKPVD